MKKYPNILKVIFAACVAVVLVLFSLLSTEVLVKPAVASVPYNLLSTPAALPLTSFSETGNIFILFEGVQGEAIEANHKSWCEAISIDQVHLSESGGIGRPTGNVVFEEIKILKPIDKASPKLAEAVCMGRVFPKVEIDFTKSCTDAGRVTYYSYQLGNVRISSYAFHSFGSAGNQEDVPTEELSISFDQIKVTYTEFDDMGKSKGKVEYSWKIEGGEIWF